MRVRSARDIGLLVRDQRRKRKLPQAELARRLGVSRQWVIAVEQGNAGAELGLVLKTLAALGLQLEIGSPSERPTKSGPAFADPPIDLDALLARKGSKAL